MIVKITPSSTVMPTSVEASPKLGNVEVISTPLLRKPKTFLWLMGAIAFLVIGFWFVSGNPEFDNTLP